MQVSYCAHRGIKAAGEASPVGYTRPMVRASILWPGAPLALSSAALFGASAPLAKLLLGDGISPWLLAGLLYFSSGIGLGFFRLVQRAIGRAPAEAPLRRADLPWLALVVLSGGAVG